MTFRTARACAACLALLLAGIIASPALAHHGWSWAEEEFTEITGIVRSVYVGNPHARLEMEVDGDVWTVDLAPPRATTNAGFTEDAVAEGETVTAIGHRSRDSQERVLKAVRIIVGEETYDVYPDRVPAE